MILDIPFFKCWVFSDYLTANQQVGQIEAYCFAVTIIPNRPLFWTVHTKDGAIYSRLPTQALSWGEGLSSLPLIAPVDPWGAIGPRAHVVAHEYLKDYGALVRWPCGRKLTGRYKFTIDYFGGAFAEDPEQHKTSNVLFLETGQVCAVPNNWCRFYDDHFTVEQELVKYRRSGEYYRLGDDLGEAHALFI